MKIKKQKTVKKDAALASFSDETLQALTEHMMQQVAAITFGRKWSAQAAATLPLAATDITLLSQGIGGTPTSGTISALNLADQLAILGHYAVLSPYSLSSRGTTTANLASTYSNGTAGVGATLTATSNAALVVDGVTYNNGDYILVKDQSSALQNGFYIVTDKGSASTPFILTRASTMNEPFECIDGRLIWVQQGTVNFRTLYAMQVIQNVTIGTTPFNFWLAGANAIQLQGRNLAATAPTLNQVLSWNGGTWLPATISLSLPFVTVGASGAQYTSIGAAVSAGNYNMVVINACGETADVNIGANGQYRILFNPNASATFNAFKINILNGTTADLEVVNGAFLFGYAVATDFITYTGSGAGNIFFDKVTFFNSSSVDSCHINALPSFSGYKQQFPNCIMNLPDQADCGAQIASGKSDALVLVSGGSSCSGALTTSRANISGLQLRGATWSSSAVVSFSQSIVSGVFVSSETGTPLIRINVNSQTTITGLVAEGGSGLRPVLFADAVISDFDLGASGSFFLGSGSGSCTISNGKTPQAFITTSGGQAKISNVDFTSGDITIQANGCTMTACNSTTGSIVIDGYNITVQGGNCGAAGGSANTVVLQSGAQNNQISGVNTEIDIIDSSGNASNRYSYQLFV